MRQRGATVQVYLAGFLTGHGILIAVMAPLASPTWSAGMGVILVGIAWWIWIALGPEEEHP